MKKPFLLLLILSVFSVAMKNPDPTVFSSSNIVWCGLDFSQAKCIGAAGFTEPDQVKNRYFSAWNDLVLTESDKYDVQEFYQKGSMKTDLSVVTERNEMPEVEELVINEPYAFEEGQLEEIISSYDLADAKEGVGVVYVVESLNKTLEMASMYVVFFDIATKDILWKQKYMETPRGFGFRNYWAGAIYKTMKASEKDYEKAQRLASKK